MRDLHTLLLGRVPYAPTYAAMVAFTNQRTHQRPSHLRDQLWICEHPPVYTQGLAGKAEHLLAPGTIPVVATDRGGQVTYHGPGQVVAYPLLDLAARGYYVKVYVHRLEEAVIRTLAYFGVTGHRVRGAPGIYVRLDDPGGHSVLRRQVALGSEPALGSDPAAQRNGSDPNSAFVGLGKIAALGIRIRQHCSYHGVALNVAMDLEPYQCINPCGYAGLRTVDLSTIGAEVDWQDAARVLGKRLEAALLP
jgi:lipoyl(octanoyl) transferase